MVRIIVALARTRNRAVPLLLYMVGAIADWTSDPSIPTYPKRKTPSHLPTNPIPGRTSTAAATRGRPPTLAARGEGGTGTRRRRRRRRRRWERRKGRRTHARGGDKKRRERRGESRLD
jgi:hypothetical protein